MGDAYTPGLESPIDGNLESISSIRGQGGLREPPSHVGGKAYIDGLVVEEISDAKGGDFDFSTEQKGAIDNAIDKVSRVGISVLMIGFGASFGYTVQDRISLAIGQALDVLGRDKDPRIAEQIGGGTVALVSIAVIVVALVTWERRNKTIERKATSEN